MDLEELRLYVRVADEIPDVVLSGYQAMAEAYLLDAGVSKNYSDARYKSVITVIVGLMVDNPTLMVTGTISSEVKGLTLNGLIVQLRAAQAEAS